MPTEVSSRGRIGNPHGAQGVKIDLVIASQLEMFKPVSARQDIEGDVQHMIRLMIRQMPLEQVETSVDVANQSRLSSDQEHGPDAAASQPLNPVGQFILNVAGGDYGAFLLRSGTILDPLEDSPLALSQLVEESRIHSKAPVSWISEDV